MRQVCCEIVELGRVRVGELGTPEGCTCGAFSLLYYGRRLLVIVSDGLGWDHVSVSANGRCPSWDEMCWVKDLFFKESECVVQFHPPKDQYVNVHPYCLHLWRCQEGDFVTPPKVCV